MRNKCLRLILFLLSCTPGVLAQNCADFIVLDRHSSSTDYATYEKVKDVVCSNEIKDSSAARNLGLKAGIPLPILDDVFNLSLQGSASSTDWFHWQSQFCHSYYNETASQLRNRNLSQEFSDNARRVVEACLNTEPVYAYYEITPSGDAFTFTFHVQGREKLKEAAVTPQGAVKNCSPENPFALSWLDRHITDLDISGQRKAFGCTWDSNQTVLVQLRLANQGDRTYALPGVVKRSVIAPPPPVPVIVSTESYRTGDMPSGACADFSPWYDLCSESKPDDWKIVTRNFQLSGDRSCTTGYAECGATTDTPAKVCFHFRMQGEGQECSHHGNTGIHYSKGTLEVVWQHH
jgi:hypothetical protein